MLTITSIPVAAVLCLGLLGLQYGGQILTSPAFSRDGTQVAFVETNGGFGILVLLKWAASTSETVSSPRTLTAVSNASYRTCTAPCMTTIDLKDGSGIQTDDTTSSVFADLSDDTAWVGGAYGWLHKITGIFLGTPAEVTGGGFPVQVNSGNVLSSPVHDYASGNVFVGDAGGYLYRVDSNTGAVTATSELDFGTGIVQGPIVDSTAGLVYVFASSDNTDTCTNGNTNCSAVYELTTSFGTGAVGSEVAVGASTAPANKTPIRCTLAPSTLHTRTRPTPPETFTFAAIPAAHPPCTRSRLLRPLPIRKWDSVALLHCDIASDLLSGDGCLQCECHRRTHGKGVRERGNQWFEPCGGGGCLFNFVDTQWQGSTAYNIGQEVLATSTTTATFTFVHRNGNFGSFAAPLAQYGRYRVRRWHCAMD